MSETSVWKTHMKLFSCRQVKAEDVNTVPSVINYAIPDFINKLYLVFYCLMKG